MFKIFTFLDDPCTPSPCNGNEVCQRLGSNGYTCSSSEKKITFLVKKSQKCLVTPSTLKDMYFRIGNILSQKKT